MVKKNARMANTKLRAKNRLGFQLRELHACWHTIETMQGKKITKRKVIEARLAKAWRVQAGNNAGDAPAQLEKGGKEHLEWLASKMRELDRAEGKGKARKSHHERYMLEWLHFENFILTVCASNHPDHILVMKWHAGDSTFDRTITKATIELYFRHLSSPFGVTIAPGVTGRNVGYETVCMAKKAITHMHRLGCRVNGVPPPPESYVAHPDVKMIVDTLEENHTPEGAVQFEFVEGVRAMREALFREDDPAHENPMERSYAWALILMMLNHMFRKSDLAGSHCPDATTLLTPDCPDEWHVEATVPTPKWFSFVVHSWKAPSKKHIKKHRVRTDSNPISPHYCPLIAYVDFASCSTLALALMQEQQKPLAERRYVALFPALTSHGIDPYSPASEGLIERLLKPVFQRAFPHLAPLYPTCHSLRVVGLIWYLRCQVPQQRSKLAGRWLGLNLKSWSAYARGGEAAAEKYRRPGRSQIDPVFMFWRASDSFVGYVE